MLDYYLIVIGASAGSLTPLKNILSALPKDFPAAILIVKHIAPNANNMLPEILSKVSQCPVMHPPNNQPIKPGCVYIAPPKCHMIVTKGKIQLKNGQRINHSIPAIDPLFYSAALYNKNLVIGILLSGLLDDGSAGLHALKKCNGISIIQDLNEAEYNDMPRNAAKAAGIDYCLPSKKIGTLLKKLVRSPLKENTPIPDITLLEDELRMNFLETDADESCINKIAAPSLFSCPECNAILWRIHDEHLDRYRCRGGHAYSFKSLLNDKEERTDAALRAALIALEEKKHFAKNLVDKAQKEQSENWPYFKKKSDEVEKHIQVLKSILKHEKFLDSM